jgi:PAS domain S-box-containing protein
MKSNKHILFAFCSSILLLIITGFYSYYTNNKYKNASNWVNHTELVMSEAEGIVMSIQNIESAQRGFVITGDLKFLDNYNKEIRNIYKTYASLKSLTTDNQQQQILLSNVLIQLKLKTGFVGNAIDVRKTRDFEAARKIIETRRGENLKNSIKRQIEKFISKEELLLKERLKTAEISFYATRRVIVFSIVFAIVVILITLYFYIKDYKRRVLSEKKVMESEQRLKSFLESLPVGIYVLGTDGTPFYANSKAGSILGKGIVPGISPDEMPEVYNAYKAGTNDLYPAGEQPILLALNGENVCVEDMEILKEGNRIPLRINSTGIKNTRGEIEYAIAVFEDISANKIAEKELIRAKKMAEESSMLKEAFLANMSHEIRTPMNAIIGFTDLLLKRKIGNEEQDFVKIIKTSGENLLRIINDVLDISKIESGMMTFERQPISIKEIFSSLSIMLSQKAFDKGLDLNFSYHRNLPDIVAGDPTRLTQIIINLVGNAIKFTEKGSVDIFAKVIENKGDGYLFEFTVKDTGIGIAGDKQKQIFERFAQAETHTTRHYGGTGLGLSIAKQLIELQGGTIGLESKIGEGTSFIFTIPFGVSDNKITEVKAQIQRADLGALKRKKILVVEDNPVNVKFITSLFEEYNIKPELAANGKEAVEKIKQNEYDVVLMDIEMPVMNGYEAALQIRQELKMNVPIIAMTAHAMAGENEKCLTAGMNGYISKPIREEVLISKMASLSKKAEAVEQEIPKENVINLEFLVSSMRGKRKLIFDTLNIVINQLPEDMDALKQAVGAEDLLNSGRLAHRIKSTVSLMGMTGMASFLEEMERTAATGNIKQIKTLHSQLCSVFKAGMEELMREKENYNN